MEEPTPKLERSYEVLYGRCVSKTKLGKDEAFPFRLHVRLSIGIFGAGDFLLRVVDGICNSILALKSY
jgi:hypothetical protein